MAKISSALLAPILFAPTLAYALAAGEPDYFIEDMSCVGGRYGLRLPSTLPEVMALAPIVKKQVDEVEQWDGYTATRQRIFFAGLEVGLVTFSNDPKRYMLSGVTIRGAKWQSLSAFQIGEAIPSVRKKFGGVGEEDGYLRSTYSGVNESVHFETKHGRVSAIVYSCYTG